MVCGPQTHRSARHKCVLCLHTHKPHPNLQGGKNVGYWFLDLSTISFVGQNEFHHHSTLLKLAIFIR